MKVRKRTGTYSIREKASPAICLILLILFTGNHSGRIMVPSVAAGSADTIRIAAEPDYPPWSMVDDEGIPGGFSVELFRAAAAATGLTVMVETGIWSSIMLDLAEGRFDALPLVGRTPERESLFDFTMPYMSLHGAIFIRKKTEDIQSLKDLRQKVVLVMKADNAEEFVRRKHVSDSIVTTATFEEAFLKLARGEGDAVITQRITGIMLLKTLKIKSVKPLETQLPEFRQDFCFAVRKGDESLLNRLNEGLSVIIANDEYHRIRSKWFGRIEAGKVTPAELAKKSLFFVVPLMILISLGWIIILRKHVRNRTASLRVEIEKHRNTVEELHQKQKLLAESEEQIRLLLNSTAEGIFGMDTDGTCTFINKSALEMLGFPGSRPVIGKDMHQLIHHSNPDGSRCNKDECDILKALRSGTGTHSDSEMFRRQDGSGFQTEYYSYPILHKEGVKGAVVTFSDITERKKEKDELQNIRNKLKEEVDERTAELNEKVKVLNNSQKAMLYMVEDLNRITEELKTEREKLQISNQELEAFTYSVSHDLRAPLRSINGFSKFLLEDYSAQLDEDGKRFIRTIRESAAKMDQLIIDLLNLSKVSKTEMNLKKTDMFSLASSVYEDMVSADQKNDFEFVLEKIPPAQCDPGMMRQVWQNLIDNALKYSAKSKKKRIEIMAQEHDSKVTYLIKDHGSGFNPRYKHKLFGLFQRLHSENEFEGNGVGLAIIRRIIQRHEGNVGAEGDIDQGATFFFTLPKKSTF